MSWEHSTISYFNLSSCLTQSINAIKERMISQECVAIT